MKTIVLGLIFLGFTNLIHSQNDFASITADLNDRYQPKKNKAINQVYASTFEAKISSKRIRKFQNYVANYDVTTADIYVEKRPTNYTITFEEGDNKIDAEYNNKGQIIHCKESFKNVKLPYAMSSDIAKKYPNWAFKNIECRVSYELDLEQQVIYNVVIENGNKKKTLVLNSEDYSL